PAGGFGIGEDAAACGGGRGPGEKAPASGPAGPGQVLAAVRKRTHLLKYGGCTRRIEAVAGVPHTRQG
ncbi:MAG: hypothetical protein OXB97_13945, partial [Rhodospirillales bacterium]|nr:hypothetical protein [Rhodospirillales bacterium]